MGSFDHLPTLADRPSPDLTKGKSRLQDTKAEQKRELIDEKRFKAEVWTRDKGCCRKCRRKVVKGIARVPERGEVHHLHGRGGELRFESRAAILLCLDCHEHVTGKVAEKWIVEPATKTGLFTVQTKNGPVTCIDARKKLKFTRVA
jgi:hypothetical protein